MLTTLLLAIGVVAATPADTTFQLPAGAHVVIEHNSGDIDVIGVNGREARVTIDGRSRGVQVSRSRATYHIVAERRWEDGAEMVVRVPYDVSVEIHTLEGDIRVYDIRGAVQINAIDGDIEVEGTGSVTAHTADGEIRLAAINGDVTVASSDGDTWLEGVAGNITVYSIDGDIVVVDAEASSAMLQTIDGDVRYEGTVDDGGHYSLSAHDGNVTFALPERAGATFSISTFDGALQTSFPVQFRGGPLRGAEFIVGSGSAQVALETFDGDIHLIRPGERAPARN